MRSGVFGMGRFGSFWSTVLQGAGPVYAYNRSPRPLPESVISADLAMVCQVDALWLCNAISAMPEVCRQIGPHLGSSTLVLDTCSVKVFPVQTMISLLPSHTPILATHPMFGPDSARHGLSGLAMVLCPVRVGDDLMANWTRYFEQKGLRVLVMTPEEHDREAARTQGLTHYLGRLLAELQIAESPIATLGYRRLTEVMEQTCNDPWELFVDLQTYNPHCAAVRDQVRQALARLNERAGFIDT